ncbi:hypothetical protein ACTFIW_009503 [Dictyostelium discoideum]
MDNGNQNDSFQLKLEKLMASESHKKVTVEPINIDSFLDENFYNESFLENCNQLKQKLLNEKSIIIKLLDELNDKSSINILFDDGKKGLDQLKEISEKRKEISLELGKQTKLTSIDNLSKYTNLINQLTRIKKYFQLLLIIHMFYSKVKLCIDQSLLSLSLKPFINLIELQNNLNSLKVPTGPRIIDHEERIDQIFPHLTKVVDHVVGDTCKVLETKMRQALLLSLKEINWINISNYNNNNNNDNNNNNSNNNNNTSTTTTSTSTSTTTSTSNDNKSNNNNNSNDDNKKKNNKNKNNKNKKNNKDDNSNKGDNNETSNNIDNNDDGSNNNNNNEINKNNNNSEINNKDNKDNINNEDKQLIDKEKEEARNKINIRDRFISNFTNLTLLQLAVQKYQKKLNDESTIKDNQNENYNNNNNQNNQKEQMNESNKLWSINLILQPLIKGFKYHFQSERVTNFIEKPEWAIHYVKKMIREYSRYLCMLQDSLEENKVYYIDLHQWFIAGLVETVKNKFRGEIKLFLERPDHYKRYFYHTMEEIVEFQRFLLEEYQYPNPIEFGNVKGGIEMGLIDDVGIIPVPFSIFQENSIFNRWLNLEIENCDQRFQQIYMNSNDRFQLYYRDEFPDLDQLRPTKSAYELISVLSSLTERYQLLTDVSYQFEFFIQIQINLLLCYKNELKSIISFLNINDDDNLHDLCFIFNSLNYCIKVLKEWDDQLIFIEIYEYMNSEKVKQQDEYSLSNSVATKGDEDYSAFSVMISDYKTLIKSLKKKIIKGLFISFATKINNYLKKGTFSINTNNNSSNNSSGGSSNSNSSGGGGLISSSISGITSKNIFSFSNLKQKSKQLIDSSQQQQQPQPQQSQSNQSQDKEINNEQQIKEDEQQKQQQSQQQDSENYTQYDVSNEISNGLSILRYQLGIIYRSLTPTKLASIWKKLLLKIDKYLFNLLLNYQPKFTENDGKQFSKDIKTCLLIFNTFSNTPENYLKRVLESTILLRMSNQDLTTFKNEFSSKLKVNLEDGLLQKYKIHNLTTDQISKIINLRI